MCATRDDSRLTTWFVPRPGDDGTDEAAPFGSLARRTCIRNSNLRRGWGVTSRAVR